MSYTDFFLYCLRLLMRLLTWNVNGIRAIVQKRGLFGTVLNLLQFSQSGGALCLTTS